MRRHLGPAIVGLVIAATWTLALPRPASQPLAFSHAKHAIACVVCHDGARGAAGAGIPDVSLCARCHATAPAPGGAAWDGRGHGNRIGWVRVTRVPDHVLFSHRRHVGLARLDCASCHGDIGVRSAPPTKAAMRLDMDTCLSCHRREGASEDCLACHR